MRFCIAPVAFWESIGFNTTHWRKSADEELALCHDKFARVLIQDFSTHKEIIIMHMEDDAFKDLLKERFTEETEITEEESEPEVKVVTEEEEEEEK